MTLLDAAYWQERLDTVAREKAVVGAVLGILRLHGDGEDELLRAATGVLNASTARNTTVDSLFQIGSITKPYTATVIMQLVDEQKISLDQPVTQILPDLHLSTEEITQAITVRHLLTHTAGLDGDVFIDTGRGDDCLEKYMEVLGEAIQIFPVGQSWSYSNSGFAILGRIIEVVTGQVWDQAIKQRLFDPLGLTHTATLPEEAILFDTAVGHLSGLPEPVVTPDWTLMRSLGAGGLITQSVADLLAFARLHLNQGTTKDGTVILSHDSAHAMRSHEVTLECDVFGNSWGLGFERFNWGGKELFGHDGNTLGQSGFLRIYPQGKAAVALLVNSGPAEPLFQSLVSEILDTVFDITMPPPLELPEEPPTVDISEWVGTYERAEVRIEIIDADPNPIFQLTQIDALARYEMNPVKRYSMTPIREGLYGAFAPDRGKILPIRFYQLPSGDRYVYFSYRSTRKIF